MTRRRVLLIAFHYPPIQGSSGVHRALAFSKYLPTFGWDVTVLTVHARAHETTRAENLALIPPAVEVVRAAAWDAARHLAILGRYPSFLALPDRWQSWVMFGTIAGLRVMRARRFDGIVSTFPIASAHLIGRTLARRTGTPWIADFRDPMATDTYPHEPGLRRRWNRIQDSVVRESSLVTVTAPGAAAFYRSRYPDIAGDKVEVIENGFDPDNFPTTPDSDPAATERPNTDAPLLLLPAAYSIRASAIPARSFGPCDASSIRPACGANPFGSDCAPAASSRNTRPC